MSLDAETSRLGANALARAHAIMDVARDVVKEVRGQITAPPWRLAKYVVEMERHLDHVDNDLQILETLYDAMKGKLG